MADDEIRTDDNGFFIERNGKRVAELHFRMSGNDLNAHHTWVEPALRGGDHAKRLVQTLVERARAEARKVVPTCPYVRKVLERTPEYADVRGTQSDS